MGNKRENRNKPNSQRIFMKKTNSEGAGAAPQLDDFKIHKFLVNLSNAHVRLTAANRRKVMRLLQEFAFGNASSVSYWDRWSKDEMKRCFLRMKPISPKMASGFRRWAAQHLEAGRNEKLALKILMDELEIRTWIEDPESGVDG
jgi:hypothetical protein